MVETILLASWAMGKGNVVIRDVVEEVNLVFLQHQASCDGVNRRIAPALVEETSSMVKRCEKVNVCVGAEPIEVAYLKV